MSEQKFCKDCEHYEFWGIGLTPPPWHRCKRYRDDVRGAAQDCDVVRFIKCFGLAWEPRKVVPIKPEPEPKPGLFRRIWEAI